ncbi:MAG: ribonuclease III [Candidatus Methylomirabilota bacterium]|nr:ribonuclease III [candidate division NC10 bacterium]PWB44809.1 MAG: ribonuclease III [candidate division NC10 bacterium]
MSSSSEVAAPSFPRSLCGHRFRDPALLEAALTHPSFTDPSQADVRLRYQRLEFLGDAVWTLYVSEVLCALLPTASEGELTRRRAGLVSAVALAEMAQRHGLAPLLLLSKGEESTGGRQKTRVLANSFEAVIGAIYLDGGIDVIRCLAQETCLRNLEEARVITDPKTVLQQLIQSRVHTVPRYRLVRRSGAPHAPTFEVEVIVNRSRMARGNGPNRQEAECDAARNALRSLPTELSTTSCSRNRSDY